MLLFWPAQGVSVTVLFTCAALALAVAVGIVWQLRSRAARRRTAALEAYAEREIARARGSDPEGQAPPTTRVASPSQRRAPTALT
jgi:hypothetical protein